MSPLRRGDRKAWYTEVTHAEDRATLESDLSADMSPKTGQKPVWFCFLVSPCFLAKSDKLTLWPISVCGMGRALLKKGLVIEVQAIPTPGVILSGRFGD